MQMWWGKPVEFWDAASVVLMWIAGVATAVAAVTGFTGSLISREVSVRTQRDSDEKISSTNAVAAEANLKLEQLRRTVAPRTLDGDAFLAHLDGVPPRPVEIMYLRDDPETYNLAFSIFFLLSQAKWPVEYPKPIPDTTSNNSFADALPKSIADESPKAMGVGGQPWGVTVVAAAIPPPGYKPGDNAETDSRIRPIAALGEALLQGLGRLAYVYAAGLPEGRIRIVVAPR